MEKILITIPFSGFYESWHSDAIDSEFDSIFEDDHRMTSARLERVKWIIHDRIDWRAAHTEYAKEYVNALAANLADWIGSKVERAKLLEFESLQSPQFYNYSTDRIFAYIPLVLLRHMYRKTPRAVLDYYVRGHFTSYDGFASSYSNDLASWDLESRLMKGEGKPLDHNEADAIFGAWLACQHYGDRLHGQPKPETPEQIEKAYDDCRDWLNIYMCEDFSGSGTLGNIIWGAMPPKVKKLADFAYTIARGDYERSAA